ncbi:MAG TPA: hypothetical protein VF981_00545 [Gemmatimonadaceae bacterium]
MRASVIAGIVLIIAGVAVYFRGGFTTKETVLDVGPVSVSAEERHPVEPWIAGLVVVAGVVLVSTGARSRA